MCLRLPRVACYNGGLSRDEIAPQLSRLFRLQHRRYSSEQGNVQ